MKNFNLEYKLEEFRKDAIDLFDESGKKYGGVEISNREAELMFELINELEDEINKIEDTKLDKTSVMQMLSDFSEQDGKTYEERSIPDSNFDDLTITLTTKDKYKLFQDWVAGE